MRSVWIAILLAAACGDSGGGAVDASPPLDGADGAGGADGGGCGQGAPAPDLALTDEGPIRGTVEGGVVAWRGIAYARPPVGELRFRSPEPLGCAAEERAAAAFGPACPQLDQGSVVGEEDCLTLNVWRPEAATAPLPILFFMHGGGNVQGSASHVVQGVALYDGRELAERGQMMVVTIQYRLGALGFLAHDALGPGNYGLEDQILALQWLQRNAAAFGGDATRLLLFGESAGALDTCALVASPRAAGLFSAALMQSGGCVADTLAEREAQGDLIAGDLGCDGAADVAACLRAADVTAVVMAGGGEPVGGGIVGSGFGPTVDGAVLPAAPLDALTAGSHNHVPFVVGANADEAGSLGVPMMTAAQYEARVRMIFGVPLGNMVLAEYPAAAYATPRQAFIQVATDAQFVCPARTICRAAEASQDEPVYRYFFTHALSGPAGVRGAVHGLELFFVFQKLGLVPTYTASADDLAVEAALLGYWTRFAATGDPNGAGAPAWPEYQGAADPYLELAATPVAGEGVRTAKCDFWDALLP